MKNTYEAEVQKEIRTLMAAIVRAAENTDVVQMLAFLTREPGGVFFLNNRHYKLDSLLARFRETYSKLRSQRIHLDREEVIVTGPESAIWIGYGEARTEAATGISASYSFTETWVWQKKDTRWMVTHYHESAG